MIDSELLDECRTLAFTVAPELAEQPLYLADESLFDGLTLNTDCLGWAISGNCPRQVYEDRLKAADLWQGPGSIIAFRSTAIQEHYPDDFRRGVLETMTHEIAHVVPPKKARSVADFGWKPDQLDRVRQLEVKCMERPMTDAFITDTHPINFCRVAIHCWARAVAAGYEVSPRGLLAGSIIRPWQTPLVITDLMAELINFRQASFSEILSHDPPTSFSENFNVDSE